MRPRQQLKNLMDKIRPYLKTYLDSKGVTPNAKGFYRCINPLHEDRNPSARLVPPDEVNLYCFSCNFTYSIFGAATVLEGRPGAGREFIEDNILYLAKLFKVPFEPMELNEEDLYRIQLRNLYRQAKNIICSCKNDEHIAYLYGWDTKTVSKWGIGTVVNWKDFIDRLAQATGYTKTFIEASGIMEAQFNEHVITFAVHDQHSNVVGFSARDSRWLPDKKRYTKWVNSPTTAIYNKSAVLYGIEAAKHYQQMYVFEGYGDVIEARLQGMLNCVALCGTSLTGEQMGLLRRLGKREIVLALDTDENNAGQDAVARIVDNHFSGKESLRAGIVEVPTDAGEKSSDPREYISKHGIQSFRDLEIKDVFKWRLDKIAPDVPAEEVGNIMIPLILHEPSHLVREGHLKCLASRTETRLIAVQREYDRILRETKLDRRRRIMNVAEDLQCKLKSSGNGSTEELVQEHFLRIKSIEKETSTVDACSEDETLDFVDKLKKDVSEAPPGLLGWHTGFKWWDEKVQGMPKKECLVTIGGVPNIGKTAVVAQLAWQIANHPKNENLMVMVMTIDDSRAQFIPRFIAIDTELPLNYISHPNGFPLTAENKRAIKKGWARVRGLVSRRKLDFKDTTNGANISFLERWISRAKEEDPKRNVIVFLDNFHKLMGQNSLDDKTVITDHIHSLDRISKAYETTIVCTMELRKHDPNHSSEQDLFGSIHLAYDNNVIIMMSQDLHHNSTSDMVWTLRQKEMGNDVTPLPQNALKFEKNKFTGWKGTQYLNFWPDRSKFFEVR